MSGLDAPNSRLWRLLWITFACSSVLTAKDQTGFKKELTDEFSLIQFDWWDASELNVRLLESDGGKRAARWAFEDHEDARRLYVGH